MITTFFILYFLLLLWILFKEPLVIILFFYLFLNQTTNYISTYYLDFGNVFMKELRTYSETGNVSLVVFVFILIATFLVYILIVWQKINILNLLNNIKYKSIPNMSLWIVLMYGVLLVLIVNILISGSPLWVSTINKTTFWNIAIFKFLKPISSQTSIIVLFSGIFYVHNSYHYRKKAWTYALFGIYLLSLIYLILMGHKFGQLLTMTWLFFLPTLIYKSLYKTLSIPKLLTIFSLIVLTFSITVTNYFVMKYGDAAFDIIQQRIFAMEGQVTHISLVNFFDNSISQPYQNFINEIQYVFGMSNKTNVGMKMLMENMMPTDYFNSYMEQSVQLAQGYIGLLLYITDNLFLAIMLHISFILSYAFTGFMLLKSILKLDFILIFLYLKIYFSFATYYAQAYTTAIFNIKTLIFVYCILLIYIFRHLSNQKRHINAIYTHN